MPGTIKEFLLRYDTVNEQGTFTNGDYVKGRVILEASKEVKIEEMFVKLKGDANVHFTERRNDHTYSYNSHDRYFKLKQVFIGDVGKDASKVVAAGRHVYEFCIQIPPTAMPPSFKGHFGRIKYELQAKLKRSWRPSRTSSCDITFSPRPDAMAPQLMSPHYAATDKKMHLFTSGKVSLRVNSDKMAYMQGEVVKIVAEVENNSSRELKLKCSLQERQSFFAQGHSKNQHHSVFKEVVASIAAGEPQTVTSDIQLPADLRPSVVNCNIIKLEYTLKVYLDVPFASDPEVVFPVVILAKGHHLSPWQNTQAAPGSYPHPSQHMPYPAASGIHHPPVPGPNPQPFPQGMYQQPANSAPAPPAYTDLYPAPGQPGPYPTPGQPGPYPTPGQPGPYPTPGQPGPYPTPGQPGPYPTPGQPGPYPTPSAPGPYPTPGQPGPYPTPGQPGPYPTPGQPGPYPTPGQPGPYPTPSAPGPYPTPGQPGPYPTPGQPGPYPTPGQPGPYPTPGQPGPYPTPYVPEPNSNSAPIAPGSLQAPTFTAPEMGTSPSAPVFELSFDSLSIKPSPSDPESSPSKPPID